MAYSYRTSSELESMNTPKPKEYFREKTHPAFFNPASSPNPQLVYTCRILVENPKMNLDNCEIRTRAVLPTSSLDRNCIFQ